MEYNFLGFIMVDEQNPRSKMQIIGIIAFIIAILIELLFSNYFMIFLLIPLIVLVRNYRILKKKTSYYQDCQFNFEFDNNCFKLKIYDLPEELCQSYIIDYENIEHICFYENGKFEMICSNFHTIHGETIDEKTFYIKLSVNDSITLEDKLMSYLNH